MDGRNPAPKEDFLRPGVRFWESGVQNFVKYPTFFAKKVPCFTATHCKPSGRQTLLHQQPPYVSWFMLVLGPDMFWVHPSRLLQRIEWELICSWGCQVVAGKKAGWKKRNWLTAANRNTGGQIALSASLFLAASFFLLAMAWRPESATPSQVKVFVPGPPALKGEPMCLWRNAGQCGQQVNGRGTSCPADIYISCSSSWLAPLLASFQATMVVFLNYLNLNAFEVGVAHVE